MISLLCVRFSSLHSNTFSTSSTEFPNPGFEADPSNPANGWTWPASDWVWMDL